MADADSFPTRIPLFPLPLVLFPGQVRQLRIFEPRYRQMLQDCLSANMPFGVVLAQPTPTNDEGTLPHRIGTLAHIAQVAQQEDGTYGIQLFGGERFSIQDFHHDKPYLQGSIQPHPFDPAAGEDVIALSADVAGLLESYLDALTKASGFRFNVYSIPSDPEPLAYLAAITLQVNNDCKQTLLAETRLENLLVTEAQLLISELDLMSWINDTIEVEQTRGFGAGNWLSVN